MPYCPTCKTDFVETVDEHIASRHDDISPTDINRLREILLKGVTATDDGRNNNSSLSDNNSSSFVSPLSLIGVLDSSIAMVTVNADAGGLMSPREVREAFRALSTHTGWMIDEANWIVQFLYWGFNTSFTEELEGSGGWDVVQRSGHNSLYVTVETMFQVMTEKSSSRKITPRRFARFLAPDIPKIVEKNPHLRSLKTVGTPVSQRLGVAPELFLVVCSIYTAIKPYATWSAAENAAHDALLRSASKEARGDASQHAPRDLRINPEVAAEMNVLGRTDAHARYAEFTNKPAKTVAAYARMARVRPESTNTMFSDVSGSH